MPQSGSFQAEYTVYKLEELPQSIQGLLSEAKEACNTAYAPYSNFKVGASVLLDNQTIHKGSNQENAAYPSGLCAERVLLNYVHANFPKQKPVAMAIAAQAAEGYTQEPIVPCGACLQVMGELEAHWQQDLEVYLYGETQVIQVLGVKNFLPFFFNKHMLLAK